MEMIVGGGCAMAVAWIVEKMFYERLCLYPFLYQRVDNRKPCRKPRPILFSFLINAVPQSCYSRQHDNLHRTHQLHAFRHPFHYHYQRFGTSYTTSSTLFHSHRWVQWCVCGWEWLDERGDRIGWSGWRWSGRWRWSGGLRREKAKC